MPAKILSTSSNATAPHYVSIQEDGTVWAGDSVTRYRVFRDAHEAHAHFIAKAMDGHHAAWSICYVLEDYIT